MVKVYLPSFAIYTLSLVVNLLALSTERVGAIAQESAILQASNEKADVVNSANVEPEILAEINRVRTNPQGYAHWLENQKQYYDRIWLKMPGEKPIRAHRLEKAIDEAIAVLKEQKPLPPLKTSEQTAATASKKLEDFAAANRNIQNISYGRITPKGIVMSLVVDELFPDRRRRKSLLSPTVEDTGVVCQNDPRYAKVCAIAYSDPEAGGENGIGQQPENSPTEAETIASQPDTPSSPSTQTTTDNPDIPEEIEENEAVEDIESAEDSAVVEGDENIEDTEEIVVEDAEVVAESETKNVEDAEAVEDIESTEVATEALPQPPQPQAPPVSEPDRVDAPAAEAENSEVEESSQADAQNEEERELAEIEQEIEEVEQEIEEAEENDREQSDEDDDEEEEKAESDNEEELEEQAEENDEAELEEVFEAEDSDEAELDQIATNSDSSRLLENVERGVLEEGDRIIAEDGSFYDSYPLEGKSGESFTIALESDEFDAFVALIDAKGNIIEQNDDISEEDSNSRIRVTIPENGVYNVIVNAYDEGGSGQYVLTVSR